MKRQLRLFSMFALVFLCLSQRFTDLDRREYEKIQDLSDFRDSVIYRAVTLSCATSFSCMLACTEASACTGFAFDPSKGSCVLIGHATLQGDDVTVSEIQMLFAFRKGTYMYICINKQKHKCTSVHVHPYIFQ